MSGLGEDLTHIGTVDLREKKVMQTEQLSPVLEEGQYVGRLRLKAIIGDFVSATCICGYPVILPQNEWGQIYGCARCHDEAKEQIEKDRAWAERLRLSEEKEKRQAKQDREFNLYPYVQELSPAQGKVFRRLVELASFDCGSVAQMIGRSQADTWGLFLKPMLECNLLLEQSSPYGEVRRYTPAVPYYVGAKVESHYSVREVAKRQLAKLDEASAPKPAIVEPPQVVKDQSDEQDIMLDEFLSENTITGQGSESEVLLRSRYTSWTDARAVPAMGVEEFTSALERVGYTRKGGKVRGLRLRKTYEMGVAQTAQ